MVTEWITIVLLKQDWSESIRTQAQKSEQPRTQSATIKLGQIKTRKYLIKMPTSWSSFSTLVCKILMSIWDKHKLASSANSVIWKEKAYHSHRPKTIKGPSQNLVGHHTQCFENLMNNCLLQCSDDEYPNTINFFLTSNKYQNTSICVIIFCDQHHQMLYFG